MDSNITTCVLPSKINREVIIQFINRYHKQENGNTTLITPYIYTKKTGKDPEWCGKKSTREPVIFGSGSIMNLCKGWKNIVIWGSGIISSVDKFDRPNMVLCVRGPLTRKRFLELGYDCPEIYGDIGLLVPRFYKPKMNKQYKVGIIPHYVDLEKCLNLFSQSQDILIIDVRNDVEEVVNEICKCEFTLSSSLHGIMVSHAYGIKSSWIKLSEKIAGDNSKYFDYYYSIGLKEITEPITLDQISHPYNAQKLRNAIESYPNPKFPIDTEKLMSLCPF